MYLEQQPPLVGVGEKQEEQQQPLVGK